MIKPKKTDQTPFESLAELIEVNYRSLSLNFFDFGYTPPILLFPQKTKHASLTINNLSPNKALYSVREALLSEVPTWSYIEKELQLFKKKADTYFLEIPKILDMYEVALKAFLKTQNIVLNFLISNTNDWNAAKNAAISELAQSFVCYNVNEVLDLNPLYSKNLADIISTITEFNVKPILTSNQTNVIKALIRFNDLYVELLNPTQYVAPTLKPSVIDNVLQRIKDEAMIENGVIFKKQTLDTIKLKSIADDFYNSIHEERNVLNKDLRRYCTLRNTMFDAVKNISIDLKNKKSNKSSFGLLRTELRLILSSDEADKKKLKSRKKFYINRTAKYLAQDEQFVKLVFDTK